MAVVSAMSLSLALAQAKEKKVKDQAEYDLFTAVTKEASPQKKLALLDEWKQKYPDSDYKDDRLKIYLQTYQALGQGQKMWDTAKEILQVEPNEVTALYWLTLLTESLPVTPETLSTGEKAAQGLLSAQKPEPVAAADWEKMTKEFGAIAHKTLGFIASQRQDQPKAEAEYRKVLEFNPNFAQVSYALGLTIVQQKDLKRQPQALYHFARAASMTGTGEIPAAQRKAVDDFFVKAYKNYHGSEDGMAELRTLAKSQPFPPAGFDIKNKNEIAAERERDMLENNPQLAMWKGIKAELTGDNGQAYFEEKMKGTAPPAFKGTVVSVDPSTRPKTVTVAIENPEVAEVTLVLGKPLARPAEPGTEIEFEGIPREFSKEPFNVTFEVEDATKIKGWPESAAPSKKAPTKRKKG